MKAAGYSRPMSTMVVELYDALVSAGAPEEKARGAAQAMSEESLATKADIAHLQADIARLEQVTKAEIAKLERATSGDIARLEQATKAEIVKLERATKADIAKLERHIAKVERELSVVKWMTGAIVAGVVSLVLKSFFG